MMRRGFKIAGFSLIGVLIVIQFFRPEKNNTPIDPMVDMIAMVQPPDQIANIFKVACYDCHSNQSVYPWYDKVQPVAWLLSSHIREGKMHLNFSGFGDMDKADRIRILVKICEEVEEGNMPLQSYKLIHKKARLSQDEVALICTWIDEETLKVMRE
jgi:hypothetical protein